MINTEKKVASTTRKEARRALHCTMLRRRYMWMWGARQASFGTGVTEAFSASIWGDAIELCQAPKKLYVNVGCTTSFIWYWRDRRFLRKHLRRRHRTLSGPEEAIVPEEAICECGVHDKLHLVPKSNRRFPCKDLRRYHRSLGIAFSLDAWS